MNTSWSAPRLRAVAVGIAALLAPRLASAGSDLAVVKIEVNVHDPDQMAFAGTGVVVQLKPPIIATCYHVVQSHYAIQIVFPTAPDSRVDVVRVAAFPSDDVAFLRFDDPTRQGFHAQIPFADAALPIAPMPPPASPSNHVTGVAGQYWRITPAGSLDPQFTPAQLHFPYPFNTIGQFSSPVVQLAVPPQSNGDVFIIDAAKIIPGFSGGPLTFESNSVGLVAGEVGLDSRNYFGVPLAHAWTAVTAAGDASPVWRTDISRATSAATRYGFRKTSRRVSARSASP